MSSNPLRDAADELDDARKKLVDAINDATEDTWGAIEALGQKVVDKVNAFTDKVLDLANVIDCKDPIKERASNWGGVCNKTDQLNKDVDNHDKGIHGQEYWTGVSRNKYDSARQLQIKAIGGMNTAGNAVQGSLNTMATGLQAAENAGKVAAVGVAVTTTSLAGLIATGASGWGAFFSALGIIGGATTTLVSVNNALNTLSDTQSQQANAIEGALKTQGDWPSPHTEDFDKHDGWVPA